MTPPVAWLSIVGITGFKPLGAAHNHCPGSRTGVFLYLHIGLHDMRKSILLFALALTFSMAVTPAHADADLRPAIQPKPTWKGKLKVWKQNAKQAALHCRIWRVDMWNDNVDWTKRKLRESDPYCAPVQTTVSVLWYLYNFSTLRR